MDAIMQSVSRIPKHFLNSDTWYAMQTRRQAVQNTIKANLKWVKSIQRLRSASHSF